MSPTTTPPTKGAFLQTHTLNYSQLHDVTELGLGHLTRVLHYATFFNPLT